MIGNKGDISNIKRMATFESIAVAIYLLVACMIVLIEVKVENFSWLKYLFFLSTIIFFLFTVAVFIIHIRNRIAAILLSICSSLLFVYLVVVVGVSFKFFLGGSL